MTDFDLDLTNPKTIEKLKKLDVTKQKPDADKEQLEDAIKQVANSQKFSITLTAPQAAHLLREASTVGKSVKEYLQELVIEKCFSERTGAPLIKRCSHHTANVIGPSGTGLVSRG
jgi:hypothetical protein